MCEHLRFMSHNHLKVASFMRIAWLGMYPLKVCKGAALTPWSNHLPEEMSFWPGKAEERKNPAGLSSTGAGIRKTIFHLQPEQISQGRHRETSNTGAHNAAFMALLVRAELRFHYRHVLYLSKGQLSRMLENIHSLL